MLDIDFSKKLTQEELDQLDEIMLNHYLWVEAYREEQEERRKNAEKRRREEKKKKAKEPKPNVFLELLQKMEQEKADNGDS